jgi:lipopolysaccharide export system protein LptC
MKSRVLTGDKGVTIRREDFEIVGDGLEFHTKTRNGRVLGNVKMTILSLDNFEQ